MTMQSQTAAQSSGLGAVLVTALFGLALVWLIGFGPSQILHNAAHDSRHALTFPCH
jgi:cobalt transporter subunit CbtB